MIWKVPYINLGKQFENQEIELTEEFKRVMSEGNFILRDDVKKFEQNIAEFLNVKYVVGVNSGTDAIFLALKSAGIKNGDEVITVSHTFHATIASIINSGAKPVLVDIDEDFNINPNRIEKAITPKTKAIIPVHLNGRVCSMEKISEIAEKYNLIIIEDACQSFGSEFKGKKSGTFGLCGCFSCHPLKTLSCPGDGGFITTNNDKIAEELRIIRDHGQKTTEQGKEIITYGYSSRLDNLHAALLNIKFKKINEFINKRRQIAEIYSNALSSLPLILPSSPNQEEDYFDTYNSYVIRTDYQKQLIEFLKNNGIEVFSHFGEPFHKNPNFSELNKLNLPTQEMICRQIVSLPIYPELTEEQIDYVLEKIKEFFEDKK